VRKPAPLAAGMLVCLGVFLLTGHAAWPETFPMSAATEECISCHVSATPGIVADWKRSLHARVTPAEALKLPSIRKRMSGESIPPELTRNTVGCAECHTLSPPLHEDTFPHNGYPVHTVVTPRNCATCHPVEEEQYRQNIMSRAHHNLMRNQLFRQLVQSINAVTRYTDGRTTLGAEDPISNEDSCLFCHGTVVEVKGFRQVHTIQGEMEFPILSGWPNMGVGRVNPDGSQGACTPCHSRHQFSIEVARNPYACAKCHKGPDVPAYKVYSASKHGAVFAATHHAYDLQSVPWVVGEHFTSPSCAACHISLVVNSDGDLVAERTHRVNDRKAWRLFGLIYAHPTPKNPDTTIIRNRAGLPLPTELTGEPAAEFLIDPKEQNKRRRTMQGVCTSCHSSQWVQGHFRRLEHSIQTTNEMTLTATRIMMDAWSEGVVRGLSAQDGLFNEGMEKQWVEQWLFYANSTRLASAMMGADYGVFAGGRWQMSRTVEQLLDWLHVKRQPKPESGEPKP